jgi:hypothetical protein
VSGRFHPVGANADEWGDVTGIRRAFKAVVYLAGAAVLAVVAYALYVVFALATHPGSVPVTSNETDVQMAAAEVPWHAYWLSGGRVVDEPHTGPGWMVVTQAWPVRDSEVLEVYVVVVTYARATAHAPGVFTRGSLLARADQPGGEAVLAYSSRVPTGIDLSRDLVDALERIPAPDQ